MKQSNLDNYGLFLNGRNYDTLFKFKKTFFIKSTKVAINIKGIKEPNVLKILTLPDR